MDHDLLIIGGGINGCAIAREASLLGLSVLLVDKGDLAGETSSKSTKLIHGGLRYLEYYEFKLVREALHERERLLKAAPHLIRGLEFVLPHEHAVRPWWMVRAGLYLYDLLGGKSSLPHSRSLTPRDRAFTDPLKGGAKGFVYWDASVDDARLTLANALDAAANGAEIDTYCALDTAERTAEGWRTTLADGRTVTARALVNAAGPWVHQMLGRLGVASRSDVRLVKGSHIVIPRLYEGERVITIANREPYVHQRGPDGHAAHPIIVVQHQSFTRDQRHPGLVHIDQRHLCTGLGKPRCEQTPHGAGAKDQHGLDRARLAVLTHRLRSHSRRAR